MTKSSAILDRPPQDRKKNQAVCFDSKEKFCFDFGNVIFNPGIGGEPDDNIPETLFHQQRRQIVRNRIKPQGGGAEHFPDNSNVCAGVNAGYRRSPPNIRLLQEASALIFLKRKEGYFAVPAVDHKPHRGS